MKDLQKIINNKVQEMIDDNSIQKAVEDGVQNAIHKAISNQFESYGSVTRALEKAIEEGLKINTKDIPFESYNEQMLVAVKAKMGAMFQSQASEKFMSEIDKVLAPAPPTMSINELVEAIVQIWKTDEPWDADHLDEFATVELSDIDRRWDIETCTLRMWKQTDDRPHLGSRSAADIQLYISGGNIRISHRAAYNPTAFSEEDALIFKLYSAGTVITDLDDFDPEDCDLTLKELDD